MKLPTASRFLFLVPLAIGGFAALVGLAFAGIWSARLLDQHWLDREFARLCQGEAFVPAHRLQLWESPLPRASRQPVPGPVSPFNSPIVMYVSIGKPVDRAILKSRKTGGLCYIDYPCRDPVVGDIITSAQSTL